MKTPLNYFACLCFIFFLTGCEGEAPLVKISKDERTWIPYTPNQEIHFQNAKNEIVSFRAAITTTKISRSGKSPSSALNQEQVSLTLNSLSPHQNSLAFALRPTKLLIGASINESGSNAEAIIKNQLGGYQITEDKYTYYTFVPEITLNGEKYKNLFYRTGHPDVSGYGYLPEYFYGKGKGLIAFRLDNRDDWFYLK